jgi:integrase
MALKAIQVENAKPNTDENRDYRVADGDGLYLLVRPNGSKLWRYDYRLNGVRRTFSIGEYDKLGDGKTQFTLAQAREEHRKAREAVDRGEHPVSPTQRAAARAKEDAEVGDRTFGALADIWLAARKESVSAKSYARDERSVKYLKDGYRRGKGFGGLPVDHVESCHLSSLLEAFNKPTRIRVLSAARKVMSVAKRKGFIKVSPFADVDFNEGFKKHREKKRPAITDETQFGELLRKMESYDGRSNNLTWYGLKLLAYTFVRPNTVAKAEWTRFDLRRARWVIPFEQLKMEWLRTENGEAMEDFVVPLSRQVIALLRELHEITGGERYLFPGCGDAEVMSENTLNNALHALGYKDIHCAHGFRSSASTILNRQRVNGRRRFERELVEIQLDHLDSSTRAVYDRDDCMPERIELMQFWADKVDELRDGGKPKLRAVA